ncbi:TRAP transporter permease [Chloroflexota bacterium]
MSTWARDESGEGITELLTKEEAAETAVKPYKPLDILFIVLTVGMVIFQLMSTQHQFQGTTSQQNTHLMLALTITFLAAFRRARRFRWVYLVLLAIGLLATGYIQIFFKEIEYSVQFGTVATLEQVIGIVMIIIPIIACYFAFGPPIAVVASLFLAYVFLGQYLPISIGHSGHTLERITLRLSIGLTSGIYGSFLQASLSYVFLLIVFGAVLQLTGASEFFMGIAKMMGQRIRGGAAQTAVIGSAMMGTVSGSPMANVAVTGAYTIPTMKSTGFRPMVAGAVEAAASTGGQIMPPVMGAAAFIMASYLGISYAKIMVVAFIPALLYFFGVFSYIFFEAGRWKPSVWREVVNTKELLFRAPLFIVPLGLLVYLLLLGYTVMMGAFWAIISAYGLCLLRKETRPSLRMTLDGVSKGAVAGCGIAVTTAVLGVMTASMTMTGLGLRIPDILQSFSGGNLIPALILAFVAALILGCGLHTIAVYTIVALTVAPGIVAMGIPQLTAHFFILYGGVFSNVTPPVAMAALVGAGIAGSKFMPTAFQALKIALPGFILPFAFIWCPPLLGNFTNPIMDILAILSVAACLFFTASGLAGYFIRGTNWLERGMMILAAVGFLGFSFTYNFSYLLGALALVAILVAWQMMRKKLEVKTA